MFVRPLLLEAELRCIRPERSQNRMSSFDVSFCRSELDRFKISLSTLLPNAILAAQDADVQNWRWRHFDCDGRMDSIQPEMAIFDEVIEVIMRTLAGSRSPAPPATLHVQHMNGFSIPLPPQCLDINATDPNPDGHVSD